MSERKQITFIRTKQGAIVRFDLLSLAMGSRISLLWFAIYYFESFNVSNWKLYFLLNSENSIVEIWLCCHLGKPNGGFWINCKLYMCVLCSMYHVWMCIQFRLYNWMADSRPKVCTVVKTTADDATHLISFTVKLPNYCHASNIGQTPTNEKREKRSGKKKKQKWRRKSRQSKHMQNFVLWTLFSLLVQWVSQKTKWKIVSTEASTANWNPKISVRHQQSPKILNIRHRKWFAQSFTIVAFCS